ncbi:MAG: hypothetical protein DRP01_01505 [Archaeoglobales archaeon]|nr:MAG: hypothetical protein DRP01_01505 [Archaeoglobales archaeon]
MARCPYCGEEISELTVDIYRCYMITYSTRLDDKGEISQEEIDRDEEPEVVEERAYCPECGELLPLEDEDEIKAFLRGEIVLLHKDDVEIRDLIVTRDFEIIHDKGKVLIVKRGDEKWIKERLGGK